MKRTVWISLLAILAFAVILIVRLPAQWVAGFIPKNVSCAQLGGTVWTGTCTGLVAQGIEVGNVSWRLQPLALLSRKLSVHLDAVRGTSFVRGDFEAASAQSFTARNVQADLPLDPALIPQLPRNLLGSARANLGLLRLEKGALTALEGHLEAHDLVQVERGQRTSLGAYSVDFSPVEPGSEPIGRLKSLSGPLDVEGTLRLTRAPGFELQGLVAARPVAPPDLVKQLAYLGSPDAQGRRQFSIENTF